MQNTVQGPIARNQGMMYGVGIAVLNIIIAFIALSTANVFIANLCYIVALLGYFFAGFVVARHTARIPDATMSGLWAGLVGGIGYLIWNILTSTVLSGMTQNATSHLGLKVGTPSASAVVLSAVILGILALLVNIGLGAGMGALGGLAGRGRATTPRADYTEAPYPQSAPLQPGTPDNQPVSSRDADVENPDVR